MRYLVKRADGTTKHVEADTLFTAERIARMDRSWPVPIASIMPDPPKKAVRWERVEVDAEETR